MIKNFSYKASRLQSCMQTILTTDLLAYIFILIAIYFAIAAAFSFCLDSFLPDGVNPNWLRAMDGIGLIVGFVYYMWIKDAMDGWAIPATTYREILNKIATFCDKYASLHGRFDNAPVIRDVRDACVALIYMSYRLFDPGDDEEDEYEEPLSRDIKDMTLSSQSIKEIVMMKKNDERSTSFVVRDLVMAISARLKSASTDAIIESSEVHHLMEQLDRILGYIESIDTGSAVPSPTIFKSHILFTLFVYFGLWLPFSFWGTIGTGFTLFIYPLTMFILTGIPLYRTWMGDPYDHSRPVHLINYFAWKKEFQHRIDHVFGLLTPEHEEEQATRITIKYKSDLQAPSTDDIMTAFNYP